MREELIAAGLEGSVRHVARKRADPVVGDDPDRLIVDPAQPLARSAPRANHTVDVLRRVLLRPRHPRGSLRSAAAAATARRAATRRAPTRRAPGAAARAPP